MRLDFSILSLLGGFVAVDLRGDLGDQLFQYATARALAERLGVRLLLDTDGYRLFKRHRSILADFGVRGKILSQRHSYRLSQLRMPTRRRFESLRVTTVAESGFDDRAALDSVTQRRVYLQGYWQDPRYFHPLREALGEELQRRSPGSANGEPARFTAHAGSVAVCLEPPPLWIHQRGRDGSREQVEAYVSYVGRAIAFVRSRIEGPKFVLFGSDKTILERVRGMPAAVQHEIVDTGKLGESRSFELQRSCNHFILSGGATAWWAGWLGHRDALRTFPRDWGWIRPREALARVPDDWVVL